MNNKFADILKLARVELILTPIFIFFKFIRHSVLDSAAPAFFKITLLSLPNFFESIVGTLTVTIIALVLNDRINKNFQIRLKIIYILSVILAGIYVITQELNILNLRGDNTVDTNDLIFSVVGLIVGYWIVWRIKPRIYS